jgi:hypothetical protein
MMNTEIKNLFLLSDKGLLTIGKLYDINNNNFFNEYKYTI